MVAKGTETGRCFKSKEDDKATNNMDTFTFNEIRALDIVGLQLSSQHNQQHVHDFSSLAYTMILSVNNWNSRERAWVVRNRRLPFLC